jgi:hypothetical protein
MTPRAAQSFPQKIFDVTVETPQVVVRPTPHRVEHFGIDSKWKVLPHDYWLTITDRWFRY